MWLVNDTLRVSDFKYLQEAELVNLLKSRKHANTTDSNQVSQNRWQDKETMAYAHNGILFSNKMNHVICCSVHGSGDYHAESVRMKWKDTEWSHSYMGYKETQGRANAQRQQKLRISLQNWAYRGGRWGPRGGGHSSRGKWTSPMENAVLEYCAH